MELGANDRVVIPKEVRETLGLKTGGEVIFIIEDGEVSLTNRATLVKKLSGAFARHDGRNLTQELLDERRIEVDYDKNSSSTHGEHKLLNEQTLGHKLVQLVENMPEDYEAEELPKTKPRGKEAW